MAGSHWCTFSFFSLELQNMFKLWNLVWLQELGRHSLRFSSEEWYYRVRELKMSNSGVARLSSCARSTVSVGCKAREPGSQGLTVSCAALPLLPWAKSTPGRAAETAEIASVIHFTSFAQNCFFSIPCALSPASAEGRWLGTRLLCSWQCVAEQGSHWVPGFAGANHFVLLGQTFCSTGRAPSFAGPAGRWGKAWDGRSGVGDSSSYGWWEGKQRGVDDDKKGNTQTLFFTICFEDILRLAVLSFQFKWCLTLSIQPGVKLASRQRSGTPSAGEAHPTGTMVGMKTGDVPLVADSFLREVGIFLCVSAPPGCNDKSFSPAPSSPSTVSSLGPGDKTLLHSLRRKPKPSCD